MNEITLTDAVFAFQDKIILSGLNVSFPPGETTVILGPSGGGKSLFIKLAAGLIHPVRGTVTIRDKDLADLKEAEELEFRQKVGFVFQDGALWANKSVYQNLELPLRFHHPDWPTVRVKEIIRTWADKFDLTHEMENRPSLLSAGEQKLVSLVRALILDPEVIFLDEPLASLDGVSAGRVTETLQALKRRGRTLILVNQVAELTAKLADRLVLLRSGHILRDGPFAQVVNDPDPRVIEILTPVLSQAATFSGDILDLLGGSQ